MTKNWVRMIGVAGLLATFAMGGAMAAGTTEPVWPWGTNPKTTSVKVYNFCDAQQAIIDNSLMSLLPAEFTWLLTYLAPDSGDLNGDSTWVTKDPMAFNITSNGWNDCHYDLKLFDWALTKNAITASGKQKPAFVDIAAHDDYTGLSYAKAYAALCANNDQFTADIGTYWGLLASLANGLPQVLLGHMTVGNGSAVFSDYDTSTPPEPNRIDCSGSAGFIQTVMFLLSDYVTNGNIDLNLYTRMPEFFAKDGDADGDGYTNACEYNYIQTAYATSDLEAKSNYYAQFALDPAKIPTPTDFCDQTLKFTATSHSRYYQVGDTMALTVATANASGVVNYQWKKGGVPITGATTDTYTLAAVTADDAGTYSCTATDDMTTVTTVNMVIKVVAAGLLPVATPVALGALIGALMGCGGLAALRKRA